MKEKLKQIKILPLLATALFAGGLFFIQKRDVVAASPGDVVINELMYHPSSGNEDDEYLELHNTTGAPIDLENWCFSEGITLVTAYSDPACFPAGTTIAAGGYIIVSPNPSMTTVTYGQTATASYAGTRLSNGGETITLIDNTDQVIDTVNYDDAPPWPTAADGDGPSLELKDPILDNTQGDNWGASIAALGGPTPNAENTWVNADLPSISNVTDPNGITDADTVNISATVTNEDSVDLVYKVNFDADVTVQMYDDGAHNDGAAGDDVYGASIPAQSAGDLVRFKVVATKSGLEQTSPHLSDSMNYHGYVIVDPSDSYDSPVINLFVSDANYNDLTINNPTNDNRYVDAVIAYDNDVYDNSRIRLRGEGRGYAKAPLKVKLPSGYKMDFAGGSNIAIDEFELLNAWWKTPSVLLTLNWMTDQIGLPTADMLPSVVKKNGEFHGFFEYANKYRSEWRQAEGFNEGVLWEDGQLFSGNDAGEYSAHYAATTSSADINLQTQKDYVLDNFDIPNILNFMSTVGLVQGYDHVSYNNTLAYYSNETGRWSGFLWDQGGIYARNPHLSPYNFRSTELSLCFNYCPVYNQPELRELYLRRFRTLLDELYTSDALKNKFNEFDTAYENDMALDIAKWSFDEANFGRHYTIDQINIGYENAKELYSSYLTLPWGIPDSQTTSDEEAVSIGEVHSDMVDANEYIRLDNSANTAVDISGWLVEGIDYTIPKGAVVPAQGSIYLLKSDVGYKAANSPVLVAGQYQNDLGNIGGTLILKTDDGATIDSYEYL